MKKISFKIIFIVTIFILLFSTIYLLYNQYAPQDNNISYDDLSSDQLINSAIMAGNYLVNATNNQGVFAYEYNALEDLVDNSNYNLLRHAGTVYSMLQLYNNSNDKKLFSMSEKALDFLLLFIKPYDNASCIVNNDDEIKLGGNALTIIALVEYTKITGDNKHLQTIQSLAKYIKQSQSESGEFLCKRYYSTRINSDFVSQYYPGEALLALCRLYDLDGNETWLNIAEKGAKYLILIRDAKYSTNDLVHDHWLLMALNELYRDRNNPLYYNQSIRIAESIMNKQRDGENIITEDPNWLGSYYTPPRSTPTATRSEGLIAAYRLARDFGNDTIAEKILKAISLGIKFQLQTQFKSEDVEDLPNPQQAIGGFHSSLTDYNVRIDYVQHNISSILGYYYIITE